MCFYIFVILLCYLSIWSSECTAQFSLPVSRDLEIYGLQTIGCWLNLCIYSLSSSGCFTQSALWCITRFLQHQSSSSAGDGRAATLTVWHATSLRHCRQRWVRGSLASWTQQASAAPHAPASCGTTSSKRASSCGEASACESELCVQWRWTGTGETACPGRSVWTNQLYFVLDITMLRSDC